MLHTDNFRTTILFLRQVVKFVKQWFFLQYGSWKYANIQFVNCIAEYLIVSSL